MKRAKLLIPMLALLALPILSVGPKVPCLLSWTPSPTSDVTGYYFYWRITNAPYVDSQRYAVTTNQPVDLRILALPKGLYYVMMTATNAYGESDPSPDAVWYYNNPKGPSNLVVQ